METSKLASWLQVGANVGILIGLVLVGFQMRQASDLTRHELESELSTQFQEQYLVLQGEAPADVIAKASEAPAELTAAELLVLEAYINKFLDYWLGVKSLADLGVVEEERWRSYLAFAATEEESYFTYVFGNQASQAYWDVARESSGWKVDQEFFSVMDAIIRGIDPDALAKWHSKIRDRLRARLALVDDARETDEEPED